MKINIKIIFYFLGFLLLINGGFMFLTALLSYFYKDGITNSLLISGVIVTAVGLLMLFLNKNHDKQIWKAARPATTRHSVKYLVSSTETNPILKLFWQLSKLACHGFGQLSFILFGCLCLPVAPCHCAFSHAKIAAFQLIGPGASHC